MGQNRALGLNGRLPWPPLPEDWANLHRITAGRKMIMGRKSYETPDRVSSPVGNLVITRQDRYSVEPGFEIVHTLEEALERYRDEEEVFVLGGAEIFQRTLPLAGTLHLTVIHSPFEADAFFPDFDEKAFTEVSRHDYPADDRHPFAYTFFVYERKNKDDYAATAILGRL